MSQTAYLNGYKIYPFESREHLLEHLEDNNLENLLVALNAEKIVKEDENLRNLINENIGYPDGIGPVLALKRQRFDTEKIPGAELWLDIIERFYQEKTFYLVGSKQYVIETTVEKLKKEFPGIDIVNYRNGYMDFFERSELIDDIIEKKPDVVFVAMGSPKQEFLMQDMFDEHEALYMGLGGSFDIYAGIKERAPEALQNMGMEWSYRLVKEPWRLFRQLSLVKFAYRLVTNKL